MDTQQLTNNNNKKMKLNKKNGIALAVSTIAAGVGLYLAYNKFSDSLSALTRSSK